MSIQSMNINAGSIETLRAKKTYHNSQIEKKKQQLSQVWKYLDLLLFVLFYFKLLFSKEKSKVTNAKN